jgi:hypothetical protein
MLSVAEMNHDRLDAYTEMVLVDIVGFSKLDAEDQYRTALLINVELEKMASVSASLGAMQMDELFLGFVPTGDGFYVVLNPSQTGYGVLFGSSLRTALLRSAQRNRNPYSGVRVSTHFGRLYGFFDITGRRNFVGPAMNECARMIHISADRAPKGFLTDSNFVFSSRTSIIAFQHKFKDSEHLRQMGYRRSDWMIYTDKHEIAHEGAFVEISRDFDWMPLEPEDYEQRVQAKMEEMLKHIDVHYKTSN